MKKNFLLSFLLLFISFSLPAQHNERQKLSPGLIARAKKALTPSFIKELRKTGREYARAKDAFYACIKQHCPQLYQEREKGKKEEEEGPEFIYPWKKEEQQRRQYGHQVMSQIWACGHTHCPNAYARYMDARDRHDKNLTKTFIILVTTTLLSMATIEALIYHLTGSHFLVD